jgi:glycerol uptake facilitator-like aquaporin
MFGKRKVAALVAEFLGTGILTLIVLSVQRSTLGLPFFVAAGAGLAVALVKFTFGNVSGAVINPALTLALIAVRKISVLTGIIYAVAQFLGAWLAYYLYTYFVNNKLQYIGGHFTWRVMVAEVVGTAIFAFGWSAAVYRRFTPTTMAAVAGLAFMVGIVAASPGSIGLLNPAIALGVRAWEWGTYVAGPLVGALLAVVTYAYLFADDRNVVLLEEPVTVTQARPVAVVAATSPAVRTTRTTTKAKAAAPKRATKATTTRAKSTTARKTTTRAKK